MEFKKRVRRIKFRTKTRIDEFEGSPTEFEIWHLEFDGVLETFEGVRQEFDEFAANFNEP